MEHLQFFDDDEYENTVPMASKEERVAAADAAESEGGEDSSSEGSDGEDDDEASGKDDGPEVLLLGDEGVTTGDGDDKEGAADASAAVAAENALEVGGQAEVILTEEQSLRFERSLTLIDIFKRSIEEMKKKVLSLESVLSTMSFTRKSVECVVLLKKTPRSSVRSRSDGTGMTRRTSSGVGW